MVTRCSTASLPALRGAAVGKPPDMPLSPASINVWLLGIIFTYV
jgi:hypothetical protein